ncbi:MAG: 50S ribosomal protein L6 [Christensenellales bacterium]
MSRIGRAPIQIPQGVTIDINDHLVTVKGPLGTLTQNVDKSIDVKVEDGHVLCTRHSDDKDHRALHGLYRALIHNMVVGVTKGFEKSLIVNGVGYKVTLNGNNKLTMNIGFSHPVEYTAPEGVTFAQPQPLEIVVKGIDRQLVGQTAATIKAIKPVEPYHGYGIHYKDETVIHKVGKRATK